MDSRMNNAEERISDLKDRIMEITQSKQQTGSQMGKKKKENESNIKDLWDNIKHANLHIIGILEGEEKWGLKMYLEKLLLKSFQT